MAFDEKEWMDKAQTGDETMAFFHRTYCRLAGFPDCSEFSTLPAGGRRAHFRSQIHRKSLKRFGFVQTVQEAPGYSR